MIRKTFVLLLLVLTAFGGAVMAAQDDIAVSVANYAGNAYVITLPELEEVLGDENVRIISTQSRNEYLQGHIPGAAYFDVETLTTDERFDFEFADVENAERVFSELGITHDALVVLYWGRDISSATFTFWALKYLGHENVKILDGGFNAWAEAGKPVETTESKYAPTEFVARTKPEYYASIEWVQANLDNPQYHFTDARGARTFLTQRLPAENVYNTPAALFFAADSQYLLPLDEVLAAFEAEGLGDPSASIVTYCTRGRLSSQVFWVLLVAGYEDVRNFEASMIGWTALGLPVASGAVNR